MQKSSAFVLFGAVATTITFLAASWPTAKSEREAYAEFIQNHPYRQPDKTDHKGPPGLDRPGEAAKFEFIRTVDPRTRSIPTQRLYRANEIGVQQIRNALTATRGSTSAEVTTDWEERGPDNIGGRTRAIMFDPNDVSGNKVWAGGVSGGLWSTSDITVDGTPWVKQNDFWENLAVTAIAHDPVVTTTFYVGTGEGFFNIDAVQGGGVFKSTDGGASFSRLASTDPATNTGFSYVQDIVVTAPGTVIASTRGTFNVPGGSTTGGIFRSTDGGASWTRVLGGGVGGASDNRATDLEIDASGNIYAALGVFSPGSVWKSVDDGATWTQQSLPVASSGNASADDDYQRVEICVAPSDANTVYVVTQERNTGAAGDNDVNHVFRTTDGGSSWTSRTTPTTGGQAWYDLICAVDPNDEDTLYLGVQTELLRSADGGGTWTDIDQGIHPDFHAIVFRSGSSTDAVIGHDGGIDYTENFNAAFVNGVTPSYTDRNDGYNVTQYYGGDLSPTSASNVAIAGAQDNSTQYFNSAGIDSATSPSPLSCCDGGFAIIDQDDSSFAVGTIQNGAMARSFDGGITFGGIDESGGFFVGQNAGLFIPNIAFDDTNDLLFSSLNQSLFPGAILRASDLKNTLTGATLDDVSIAGLTAETSVHTVSPFTAAGVSTVFLGTATGSVLKAENVQPGGTISTSNITGTINAGYVSSIELGMDEDHILVTLSNYGINSIYESLDGGSSWSSKQGDLPDMPVRWAMYNPNDFDQVIAATESGIWETLDIGAASPTWSRVPGFPTVRVDQLQTRTSDGTVYAFTHGRGLWSAQWRTASATSTTTAVVSDGTPTTFGDTITFTATVTGTSNPTGTVTFRADTVDITGCVDVTLSGGGNMPTAECMVSSLDAGTYSIVAAYGGDVSNSPSTSSGITQTVNQATQTISFTAPGTQTFSNGGTFALSATGGGSGNPVVFASTTTGVCTVSGSTATIVSAGMCTITANQAGNTNYSAAPQVSRNVTIEQADQTITFADPGTQTYSNGGSFGLSATGGDSGNPIVFASTTTDVCTVSGSTASIVTAGTCTLTANQAGNTNYSAAPQVSRNVTIEQADQTITFSDPGPQTYANGGSFGLSASGGGSGNPVVFASTTTSVCTVSDATVSMVSAGTCSLTANQAGNVNYNAAPQVDRDVTINPADQTITFAAIADQDLTSVSVGASASASSGLPITLTSNTPAICGTSGLTVTLDSRGVCELTATQPGDGNFNAAAPVDRSFIIEEPTMVSFFTSPNPSDPGVPYTVNVTVSAPESIPSGSVVITDNNSQTCQFQAPSGTGSCDITPVTTGIQTLTATFTGTDFFADSVHVDTHAVGETTDLTAAVSAATPVLEMSDATLSVVIANNGPLDAMGSALTISGMTTLNGLVWTCAAVDIGGGLVATCPASNGTGTLTTTVDLPVDGALEFQFTGMVTGAPGSTVDVTAEVQPPSGISEGVPADNVANESFQVGEQAIFDDGFETP